MASSLDGSLTTKRSAGDRPVRAPVSTRSAPVSDSTPSPRANAMSIKSGEDKPVWISGLERAASLMLVSVLSTM